MQKNFIWTRCQGYPQKWALAAGLKLLKRLHLRLEVDENIIKSFGSFRILDTSAKHTEHSLTNDI